MWFAPLVKPLVSFIFVLTYLGFTLNLRSEMGPRYHNQAPQMQQERGHNHNRSGTEHILLKKYLID